MPCGPLQEVLECQRDLGCLWCHEPFDCLPVHGDRVRRPCNGLLGPGWVYRHNLWSEGRRNTVQGLVHESPPPEEVLSVGRRGEIRWLLLELELGLMRDLIRRHLHGGGSNKPSTLGSGPPCPPLGGPSRAMDCGLPSRAVDPMPGPGDLSTEFSPQLGPCFRMV